MGDPAMLFDAASTPGVVPNLRPSLGTGGGNSAQDMSELEIFKMNQKTTTSQPPLDRWRLDAVLEPNRPLWGLSAIAACLGVSTDTARRWATDAASGLPVSKPGGRWFAERTALLAWRRGK